MEKILGFILAAGLILPAAALAAGPDYPPLSPSKNGRPVAAVHYLAPEAEGEIRLAAQVLAPGATLEAVRIDNITGRSALWRSDGEGEAGPLTVAREGETLADGRGKMRFGPLGEAEEMLALTLADNDGAFKDRQADFRVTFFMAGGARAMCLLKAADQPATYLARTSKEAPAARAQPAPDKPKQPPEAPKQQAAEAPERQATVKERGGDVYVAGVNSYRATLWKNGVAQTLSSAESFAHSVFVSGGDVYVAGGVFLDSSYNSRATLWKNGVAQTLSSNGSFARSVFVSGGDVNVAGRDGDGHATLWKNGVAQTLGENSEPNSVFVSGGDVYVAGDVYISGSDGSLATLWKNGVAQTLDDGDCANSVFVSGGDVYVAGDGGAEYTSATLWKNGVAQTLSGYGSFAKSVFVSGGDVFVAGYVGDENLSATLWKNGVAQTLGENSEPNSVFVSGGDVYVAGKAYSGGTSHATLWKNGVAQKLSRSANSSAHSVFVSTK